jgi:hypothetical protein
MMEVVSGRLWVALVATAMLPIAESQAPMARPFVIAVTQTVHSKPPATGLLPIARFTGQTWMNTWPAPVDRDLPGSLPSLDLVPASWTDGPVPRTWMIWRSARDKTAVRVNRLAHDAGGCELLTLLMLDREPRRGASPDRWPPLIAVSNEHLIEPFVHLDKADREFANMVPTIEAMFRANEERVLGSPGLTRQSDLAGRREEINVGALPIVVGELSRPENARPNSLYYFEATKETTRSDHLLFGVRVAAWIRATAPGRWMIVDINGSAFSDEGIKHAAPLGIVRVGDRTFVVTAIGYYEGLEFTIDELLPGSVRHIVAASGGGC